MWAKQQTHSSKVRTLKKQAHWIKLSRWRNSSFYRCLVQFISCRKEVRVASSQRRAFLIQILFVNLLIFCMKKHSVVLHYHSWCASIPHSRDHNPNTLPFRESVCVTRISSIRKGRVIRYNFARIRPRVINPRYGFGFFPEDLEKFFPVYRLWFIYHPSNHWDCRWLHLTTHVINWLQPTKSSFDGLNERNSGLEVNFVHRVPWGHASVATWIDWLVILTSQSKHKRVC